MLTITTTPAIRVVVTGGTHYFEAGAAAFEQACKVLGTDRLNLVDCTKRLADNAFLFTYSAITSDLEAGATGVTR